MTIPRRRIGTTGPEVSVLALGSWHTYDRMDFHAAVELVRRAAEAGINCFDVGVYGGVPLVPGGPVHHSHTDVLFGRIIERAGVPRAAYVLSVKLWLQRWPAVPLADQLDRALDRVGTSHADFAVLGDIPAGADVDLRRLVRELGALVARRRLGAWGVNNWSVADLRRAHAIAAAESAPGPQMAQLKYSLCRRTMAEGEPYRRLFEETGIGLEASDVMEGGILAGNLDPDRVIGRDPGNVREAIRAAAPRAAEIAREFGATAAQLCIAFCLGHPALVTVLFGVTRLEQLEENLAAVELADRHGVAIRQRVAELWVDRGVVDPGGAVDLGGAGARA
jgi:L-glyceraldehyde 3-phosphate reductase